MSWNMSVKSRDELNALCEGVKVKRASKFVTARRELPGRTGNYVRTFVKIAILTKPKYAEGAYRADKKRGGNCPDYRGWDLMKVNNAAKRDY